jgi:Plasmid pRiA4b ORF-3-like protein
VDITPSDITPSLIAPSVITPQLADAALASEAFGGAIALAKWIGDGKEVTASGVLGPVAAAQARAALGIRRPRGKGKVRSPSDVPELDLEYVWEVAHDVGLITIDGEQVRGSGFEDVTADAGAALQSWLRALAIQLGVPDEPCGHCLTVLAAFAEAEGPVAAEEVALLVRAAFPRDDDDSASHEEDAEHVLAAIDKFAVFGAIAAMDDPADRRARLTPLGRMLADSVFGAMAPDPAADAGTLVGVVGVQTLPVGMMIARPWLAARTPADAVREVLAFAEHADADLRVIAIAFATAIGPAGEPAWREYEQLPGFGAYARSWLAQQGERVPVTMRDEAWLAADSFSAHVAMLPPMLLSVILTSMPAAETTALLRQLRDSGHPDAERLLEAASAAGVRTPRPRVRPALPPSTGVHQLKITLRDVTDPPVWRRVLVPAGVGQDRLATIIEATMGWDGWHQHMFGAGRLAKPGDELVYTYDFGDGWEHDIVLEDIIQNAQGVTPPVCLGGEGACPPEDCGGPWGYAELKAVLADPAHKQHDERLDWLGLESGDEFDPALFSVDAVNARLSGLRKAPEPVRTVVRVQPRAKKRKATRKGRRERG